MMAAAPFQQPVVQAAPVAPALPQVPPPAQVVAPNPPVQIPVSDQNEMSQTLNAMATAMPAPPVASLDEAKASLIREVNR